MNVRQKRIALSLLGLALVVLSMLLMFQWQIGWGWLLLAAAFGVTYLARHIA